MKTSFKIFFASISALVIFDNDNDITGHMDDWLGITTHKTICGY